MDPTLMYDSVNKGEVDIITAYTSDGRIKKYDLVILKDDLKAIPPYHTLALISPRAMKKKPFLYEILQKLENKISLPTMQKLNYLVDEQGKTTKEAADIFLRELDNK
jgi:osmoprotectant transport system substrate-binding protein